jgi:lipopolysaccharide/colanic/teichoic acid biosynthesis glycosyltransferase
MAAQTDKERFYVEVILPAKLRIDLQYCSEITFVSDLHFLFLTLGRLFRRPPLRNSADHSIEHLAAVSKLTREA